MSAPGILNPAVKAIKYWHLTASGLIGPAGLAFGIASVPHKELASSREAWVLLLCCAGVLLLWSHAYPLAFWKLRAQLARGVVLFLLLLFAWSAASFLMATEFSMRHGVVRSATEGISISLALTAVGILIFCLRGRKLASRAVD